ncbi:MAG: (2Fe-2S)-binding protein [Candidatus Binatia bacterium]
MKRDIEVTVNGTKHELSIEPRETLLEIIRQHLDLTGAKLGCDQQVCGTCTVLLDGLPVSSCSVLGVDAEGCEVLTIEGLASDGDLHPIQQAFIDTGAFQCAFCTPGMILAVKALKDQMSAPSEEQIRHFLAGNICRCGCHMEILEVARSLF